MDKYLNIRMGKKLYRKLTRDAAAWAKENDRSLSWSAYIRHLIEVA